MMFFSSRLWIPLLFSFLSLFSSAECGRAHGLDAVERNLRFASMIPNDNRTSFFEGEWLIAYFKTPRPVCDFLDPIFEKLHNDKELKDLKFAKITLFPVEEDIDFPIILHIKDGLVRKYEGQFEWDQLADYIKKNHSWFAPSPTKKAECRESVFSEISSEIFNLIRGTLALAALILLFAWAFDVFNCHKPRGPDSLDSLNLNEQNDYTDEKVNEDLTENVSEKTEEALLKTEAIEKNENNTEIPDLIDVADDNVGSSDGINKTHGNTQEEIIINEGIPSEPSAKPLKPIKLNPFETSNESLAKSRSVLLQINQVKESVLVEPIEHTATQIAHIHATKIEKSSVSELSPKKAKIGKAKPPRTTGGDLKNSPKSKTFKVNEVVEETPNIQEAVTMETKLQIRQETILVEPIVQETVTLQAVNEATTIDKKSDSNESKC